MALQPIPSPSSGDSHSPSPELPSDGTSANASPVTSATPLYAPPPASDEGDSPQDRSTRSTPTRAMSDLTRSSSAGKGGCWTCRVRRKKCDEEREGDSCKTCLRLRIQCLGWGPKRPDWMRDKEKVAAYKASIKEQLSRMGLIRGQPRQPWHSAGLSASSQPATPGVAGPGPQTTLRRTMSARETTFRRDSYIGTGGSAPYHIPGMSRPISDADQWGHNVSASSSRHHPSASPMASLLHNHSTPNINESLYGFPSPPMPMGAGDDIPYTGFLPQQGMSISMPPPMPAPPAPTVRRDEYISYYFKYVRELQYVFAGESLTNLLLPIVQADPDGAVALSLCALAALHHGRAQMARSTQPILEDPDAENSLPRQFYNRALYLLMHSPQTNGTGQYSDSDAVTACQLIAYSLLGGGSTDWATPLDYACEWLAQTGIYNEENPKLALLNMSPAGRFAAKATMYADIFSSITLMQPPRFLSLYKRLFGGGAGFWPINTSPTAHAQHSELRMDTLSGCPDEALLAIAEISALAHWKATELQSGSLSMRELIRRGDAIEKELRERAMGKSGDIEDLKTPTVASSSSLAGGLDMPAGLAMASSSSLMSSPQPGMSGASKSTRSPVDSTKHIIGEMYREAALLYLHTVLSDSSPGVPEIATSVDQMAKLLNELPPSRYDRALIFPLFLTGCLTDNQMMREVIKHRFFMQDATNGNILLAQTVMDEVWIQRANAIRMTRQGEHPRLTDWRQSLRLQWASLFLA
ncbi:hypothetical protein DICSQDRAFT_159813 [Dichomitus squalens LYAD-421 SS1]|uniref:uncharacterized protein n=1 Tax=Dichomitus squalens (strain LYAD-421) TaxID=732165 RepID=UPI0004411324|nr:uncharacterized protein DICSQDRAFT_159813 [Dichomitus squalens LYAD-421 SS1]EJF64783.1 hypothetical protein DICSQDRAFT_159813 [Dichomitus squalens LYAD-421 SS1]